MLKPVAAFAAVGVIGAVLAKVLLALLLPVFGVMLSVFVIGIKVVLIAALLWLGYKLFIKLTERPAEG